mmetsp:Transcript_64111/g.125918  ORF Transcript_64111/g.125918 Transcript_64111/m.125918 type:complete len:238 (-) Transcript_64111:59-772(-)
MLAVGLFRCGVCGLFLSRGVAEPGGAAHAARVRWALHRGGVRGGQAGGAGGQAGPCGGGPLAAEPARRHVWHVGRPTPRLRLLPRVPPRPVLLPREELERCPFCARRLFVSHARRPGLTRGSIRRWRRWGEGQRPWEWAHFFCGGAHGRRGERLRARSHADGHRRRQARLRHAGKQGGGGGRGGEGPWRCQQNRTAEADEPAVGSSLGPGRGYCTNKEIGNCLRHPADHLNHKQKPA